MEFAQLFLDFAWWLHGGVALLVLATRFLSNVRAIWALMGVLLLIVALGDAMLVSLALRFPDVKGNLEASMSLHAVQLFGLVVFGSLGARFLGEWLTSGAK